MKLPVPVERCLQCDEEIDYRRYSHTTHKYGFPMCMTCENEFLQKKQIATKSEQILYVELLKEGIPAKLQHNDGVKALDIAIESAQLHIEVEGPERAAPRQVIKDFYRTIYSVKANILTMRIPNKLVSAKLKDTVKSIRKLYDIRKSK